MRKSIKMISLRDSAMPIVEAIVEGNKGNVVK